jgi:hypothetical protein
MNASRILKAARTTAIWAGLALMAAVVFTESRIVWRCQDVCAQSQVRSPQPAFNPADWPCH